MVALAMLFCRYVLMLSSYVMSFTGACVDISDEYILKRVGDKTSPCGLPFLNWRSLTLHVHWPVW